MSLALCKGSWGRWGSPACPAKVAGLVLGDGTPRAWKPITNEMGGGSKKRVHILDSSLIFLLLVATSS